MLINSNRHINTQTFWRKKFYCEYFTVGIRHLAISRDQWHKYHHNDVLIQVSWVGLHGPLYPWGILRSHIFYQKVIFLLETNNDTAFPKWMKLILHKYGFIYLVYTVLTQPICLGQPVLSLQLNFQLPAGEPEVLKKECSMESDRHEFKYQFHNSIRFAALGTLSNYFWASVSHLHDENDIFLANTLWGLKTMIYD